ncbi:MAG TPA: choice-of-anchor Q domain-containing protein [Kofleriaceae bacterium]|jgi:hypothetical protein
MRFLACGVLVALAACTSPNPKSCLDGSCTDPRYPFCDENGVIADEPKTCVAVSCTAGDIAECRGDVAVTCNASGDNFDLIQCPRGCDATGCRVCASNDDCTTPTAPLCDLSTNACHACVANDDCASGVCNADGSCEAASNVVIALPTGAPTGECTLAAPCSLPHAIELVTAVPTRVMRMLPGTYTDPFKFAQTTGAMVRVIAPGAILGATSEFVVSGGAKVHVEDLESRIATTTTSTGALCSSSTLELLRVKLHSTGYGEALRITMSVATLDQVDIDVGSNYPIISGPSSVIIVDRTRIRSSISGFCLWNTLGTSQNIRVTNSIFDNCSPTFNSNDTADTVSQFRFAFNTFVFRDTMQFECPGTADSGKKIIRVENNVIVALATQPSAVLYPQTCGPFGDNLMNKMDHNLIYPFTGAVGTNVVMDPKFVSSATSDFHIQATSPARDAAVPSSDLTTNHDYDGMARTGMLDIGAYEVQ